MSLEIYGGPGAEPQFFYWSVYGAGLLKSVQEHPELYEGQSGIAAPTFEHECAARRLMADLAEGASAGGKPTDSPYFADLLKVHQAGYLAEYVWLFCSQPSWREEERPKRMAAFIHWVRSNLTNHVVKTCAGVRIDPEGQGESPAPAGAARPPVEVKGAGGVEFQSKVREAFALLQRGNKAEAARLAQDIHRAVRALQTEPGAVYLCFYNQGELNFYLAGHREIRSVRTLAWGISDALLVEALILSEEGRFAEALTFLEELTRLAPFMAAGHVEKGFMLNRLRRPKEALVAYYKAWSLASRLPAQSGAAGKALRGLGVTLVELGDLDAAEKMLLDALIIEPDSKVARNELSYIGNLKRGGRPAELDKAPPQTLPNPPSPA